MKLSKKQKAAEEEEVKDPIENKLGELVRHVHGSLEAKQKLIDDFNEVHPECSKFSIERKIKMGFVKDKRGEDP